MLDLAIIIVNYRSANLILDCIESIYAQQMKIAFEIIVVDNDSKDNSKNLIQEKFPGVRFLDMGYNAGFARANNKGMREVKAKSYLLLNPDTLVRDNAIEKAFLQLHESKHIACGVQLLNRDGSHQISGSYFMTGGLNLLLALPYWGKFLRSIAFAIQVKKPHVKEAASEVLVDWISGAFLMIKSQVLEEVGEMDEDFFLYGEEVEWCSRMGKKGSLALFGNYAVVHLMGEAIGDATATSDKSYSNLFDKKGLQLMISNLVFVRKKFGIGWYLIHLINYTITIPVYLVLGVLEFILGYNSLGKFINRFLGFTSNVLKAWMLLPTIASNRPHFYKML